MKPKIRKYIVENIGKKTLEEIAVELNVSPREVKRFLKMRQQEGLAGGLGVRPEERGDVLPLVFRKVLFFLLAGLIVVSGVVLRCVHQGDVFVRSPDEMIYTAQAADIAERGIGRTRGMVREYNEDRDAWRYPNPLRVGFLWPLAAAMKIAHHRGPETGSWLSCFFSIASLLLLVRWGWKFFPPWAALYALLFLSFSPMDLAISRRAWQDATIGFFGSALVYLCFEISRDSKRILWPSLFVLSGSYLILLKETCAVILGLCAAWILWVLFVRDRAFLRGLIFLAALFISVALSVGLLAGLSGGISHILDPLRHQTSTGLGSEYVRDYCSGPWHDFFVLVWMMNPVNVFLFFAGIAGVFFSRREEARGALFGLMFVMVSHSVAMMMTKVLFLNLRYFSFLFGPFYLFCGLGLWFAARPILVRLKGWLLTVFVAALIGACIILAVKDYGTFEKVFVRAQIKDLSIGLIRQSL